MLLSGPFWTRMIAINAFACMLAVIAFGTGGSPFDWRRAVHSAAVSFTFSTSISPFCTAVLTRVAGPIMRRHSAFVAWSMVASILGSIAIAGTLFGSGVLVAAGFVTPRQYWHLFAQAAPQSLVFTLTIGLFATAYGRAKERLAEANLALRTKERDEAEARRLASEAQLAALESRVQPHFLFNTLNSIAALAHDDPARAEKMTTDLASLMRSTLDRQAPLVPLDDELRVVRTYLDIERVRFGDRLRYGIEADGVGDMRVPRLAVQTLVENSVKYAVSARRDGASILVRADAPAADRVRIAVRDDGPGFDGSALPAGHGLALLRSRLEMLFGDRATLVIDGRPGETRVTIEIADSGLRIPD
jgi:two-component system, LytTR family, sensor histidine kinase AlgZ